MNEKLKKIPISQTVDNRKSVIITSEYNSSSKNFFFKSHARLWLFRSVRQPQRIPGTSEYGPCVKAFTPFVDVQVLEAFAGEVVDGCSDMVASGPECQWKFQLV
ncbi:hypothetical protein CDAR_199241 [Caerostris darwini]|uniref:Uncharacterized protein n=1 Tax=Caerostris darwini TaxID=1538125 RepID=A0AAV4QHL8_9ARAC|nr:hypothetical protein CDAR_199241 [Caerostris darwini]